MRLFELFDNGGKMMQQMRQAVLDIITPLMSQDVPFVTVQQVIDGLRHNKFGISVDRGLVMQILDPDEVKSIDKIEGDRVYFVSPNGPSRDASEKQDEQDQDHLKDVAQNQAKKDITQQQQAPSLPTSPQK